MSDRLRALGLLAATALWAFLVVLAATAAEARVFRAADTQLADYPTVQALYHFDRLVRERTEGRHSVAVFHSRQLGEERETIEQTRVGAIDINRTNAAPLADLAPDLGALSLPFLFSGPRHLYAVLDGPIGEGILARLEERGLIGLAFYDSGSRSIYNSVRPVRSLDDLRGLRIRVQQSELMVETMRALGAQPVALPYGQVETALATKIVDGAENNWPSYVTTGHARLAPFITLTEHTMTPEVLVMSKRAWDGLSPSDQAAFRSAARDSSLFMREIWKSWEERARADAARHGATVIADFDVEPFRRALEPLYQRALADPRMRDLVERIRALR
jgi:tripartite ATP-independent transporter DctP family solute receptor